MSTTYAPYNFIPFAEQPLRRYANGEDLPAHGRWYPELLSGEIRLRITAQTPIYVGNGEKGDKADFFRTASGQYAIPGSTLRGLIRENMQILGFGLLRPEEDFQNYRILYRKMADGSLGSDLKTLYQERLGVKNSPPKEVRGGFLCCDEPHRYHIVPVSTVYIAERKLPENKTWKDLTACDLTIYYKPEGTTKLGDPTATLSETPREGYEKGTLHCVGWMNNQNTLYVFPEPAEDAEPIELSEEDIISYEEDYEARKNSLGGTRKTKMDKNFWALPKPNQRKPVFFLQRRSFTSFGMSRYLRIAYGSSIEQGLPEGQQNAAEEAVFLDYPYAILGFSTKKESYRSRIQFEDLTVEKAPQQSELFHMQLEEPKLSFYPGYTKDGQHYNTPGFQFNGIKQYWMKPTQKQAVSASASAAPMKPLFEGTEFVGSVRYHNLHPDELGLLLWCLVLEEDCMQSIGRGKPYGYGRVSICVEELCEFDPAALYGTGKLLSLPSVQRKPQDRIRELISTYKKTLRNKFYIMVTDNPAIQDFLYMKRTVQPVSVSFSYMSLQDKEFQKISQPLPTVAEYRAGTVLPEALPVWEAGQRCGDSAAPSTSRTSGAVPKPGSYVEGTVSKILDSGFVVELDDGGSGFVPLKEIAFRYVVRGTVEDYVHIGQHVCVKVLEPYKGKTSLSLKQAKD